MSESEVKKAMDEKIAAIMSQVSEFTKITTPSLEVWLMQAWVSGFEYQYEKTKIFLTEHLR